MPGALTNNMLDKMIEEGKVFYLMDRFIPCIADKHKIGFTPSELNWCRKNETNMWAYFIENDLLFNSDPVIINRFVNDGPFTAAFQRESPARAAIWVGWQIVRTYMDRNKQVSLDELIRKQDFRGILRASGYKPRRISF